AFVVQWTLSIISVIIVLSPFVYLSIRRWRKNISASWLQIAIAYIISILSSCLLVWAIIFGNILDYGVLEDYIIKSVQWMIVLSILAWLLLIFISVKLVKGRFTIINMFIAVFTTCLIIWVSVKWLLPYAVALMLGYVRNNL
ncbi:MAG: hypothetical protein UT07_C0010G0001, partial [Parcubacteria group bacterium GW2011_GWB1_38_8]